MARNQTQEVLEQLYTLVLDKYAGPNVKWKREGDEEIFQNVYRPHVKTIVMGLVRGLAEDVSRTVGKIVFFDVNGVNIILICERGDLKVRTGLNTKKINRWFEAVKQVLFETNPQANPLVGGICLKVRGEEYRLKLESWVKLDLLLKVHKARN